MASSSLALRTQRTSVLSRHLGALVVRIAEEDAEGVLHRLDKLQDTYAQLESYHDDVCDEMISVTDVNADILDKINEQNQWFDKIRENYMHQIKSAWSWVKQTDYYEQHYADKLGKGDADVKPKIPTVISTVPASANLRFAALDETSSVNNPLAGATMATAVPEPDTSVVTPHLSVPSETDTLLSVLHSQLGTFSGDPTEYYSFMSRYEAIIEGRNLSDRLKLVLLIDNLSPEVRSDLDEALIDASTTGYNDARRVLYRRYGTPQHIAQHVMRQLKSMPKCKNPNDLRLLSNKVATVNKILLKHGAYNEVNSQDTIYAVVEKCPQIIRNEWERFTLKTKRQTGLYPSFQKFSDYLKDKYEDLSDPRWGKTSFATNFDQAHSSNDRRTGRVHFVDSENAFDNVTYSGNVSADSCVICGDKEHQIYQCAKFKAMSPYVRYQLVRERKLCFSCFSPTHMLSKCKNVRTCGIDGCVASHSRWLHKKVYSSPNATLGNNVGNTAASHTGYFAEIPPPPPEFVNITSSELNCPSSLHVTPTDSESKCSTSVWSCHTASYTHRVTLPMCNVMVEDKHKCTVLMDSGSTDTLISSRLVDKLGLPTKEVSCKIHTLGDSQVKIARVTSFHITSLYDGKRYYLDRVFVVPAMPAVCPPMNHIQYKEYPHLSDLHVTPLVSDGLADLILGLDEGDLFCPIEVRAPPPGKNRHQPYGFITKLGPVLAGAFKLPQAEIKRFIDDNPGQIHRCQVYSYSGSIEAKGIEQDLQNLWNVENEQLSCNDELGWSQDDLYVFQLWEKETTFVNDHYVVPVPWKQGQPFFPRNKTMALKRLESTRRKIDRLDMFSVYHENIMRYVHDGHAEIVPRNEIMRDDGKVWYLPHHAVISVNRPGKVRIVFDCAAKCGNVSLNTECFQGPDLCSRLLKVLVKFRQHKYAVIGDVQSMYLNVHLPVDDRDCFRFLWYQGDDVTEYRMLAHVFGGIFCSASSTYALRRILRDFNAPLSVAEAVQESFYVDDMLRSLQGLYQAAKLVLEICRYLAFGGFRMTKFQANDLRITAGLDSEDLADSGVQELTSETCSKALGIVWCVGTDEFTYRYTPVDSDVVITRRIILSEVSQLFDPLGLIQPVILAGRLIFRDTTVRNLSWDDPVPDSIKVCWLQWRQSLISLAGLHFPRCVVPDDSVVDSVFLSHFCDASIFAYGCVTYLCGRHTDGSKWAVLLTAKARLAPLKIQTIPRLELLAATLAVKSDVACRSMLDFGLQPSAFYSDSQVVLSYISADAARFKVFVCNRVTYIRRHADPAQWSYVSTATNIADLVTRGCTPDRLRETWLHGPKFLTAAESNVTEQLVSITISDSDPEVKKSSCNVTVSVTSKHPLDSLIEHYSNYLRLCKAVSWWRKVLFHLQSHRVDPITPISVGDLNQSETVLIEHAQGSIFAAEISCLKSGKQIPRNSEILALDPEISGGLMRVGGRIRHTRIHDETKHPIILSGKSPLSRIMLLSEHNKFHLGSEWVLTRIRSRFWITRARSILKSIRHKCATCQRLSGHPKYPKMADLPSTRVNPTNISFEHTGCDAFGPFYTTLKRTSFKRWGLVFSCMTTRAVHLEMLANISTDSFICAFTRFISRRGLPKQIRSDCGSNFVGARSEMAALFSQVDRCALVNAARLHNVEWIFGTPLASHHGGFYERQIRTLRRVMMAIMPPYPLSDEILNTLFIQVEHVVNTRPLTALSDSITDMEPLTPNRLLLFTSAEIPDWGRFTQADCLRMKWKLIQTLVSSFWQRWLREYLPELTTRAKWNHDVPNYQVGDLVLLMESNVPRGKWPLARVIDCVVSSDGKVRSARVKTAVTELLRPVTKLVPLELD